MSRPVFLLTRLAVVLWLGIGIAIACGQAVAQSDAPQLTPPATGQDNDAAMWRAVRGGQPGYVSIPDQQAGVLVQSEGESWRAWRNGPISTYGVWLIIGTIGLLALFFALRGRIRIESGRSGHRIARFTLFERLIHWVTAITFILLGLTGLNLLYGRYVLRPVLGDDGFAALTMAGKYLHNYGGFVFMVGIFLMLVVWIRNNLPNRLDLAWLARGGGLLRKGSHPPARKFNAGQKIIFLCVIVGGVILSYTGLNLMFPFAAGATIQDMQSTQLMHVIASLVMIALILAHIYIGSLGMEGAFEAIWEGMVDENWAKEHHSEWVKEIADARREAAPSSHAAPAE